MSDSGGKEFWELTQEAVQPLIQKPVLTEKLLRKPPFRFIHDIFTHMTAANGFGEGLLLGSDASSGSFSEKPAKAACLKRIIEYVSLVNKREIDVDPNKLVSGREPEKSNTFLRDMAAAMKAEPHHWERALKEVTANDPPPAPQECASPPPPPPPPPDEESTCPAVAKKSGSISIETKGAPAPTRSSPAGEKPANWDELAARTKELRVKAEAHGADMTGCSTFNNKALGTEILSMQKEVTLASKQRTEDPLSDYDLPDQPDDVDKLVALIEEQLTAVRITNEIMQGNEQILDQLTKVIIPQS